MHAYVYMRARVCTCACAHTHTHTLTHTHMPCGDWGEMKLENVGGERITDSLLQRVRGLRNKNQSSRRGAVVNESD